MASAESDGFLHWQTIPALVTRYAHQLVIGIILLTGLAILQLVDISSGKIKLQIDPSVERLLAPDNEAYQFYQSTRRIFGSDETILLLLQTDNVFSKAHMDVNLRLTRRLEKIDGVVRVVSLANALTIRGSEFGIDIESYADMTPLTPEALQIFRSQILSNPMYAGSLVTESGNVTAILISLADTPGYNFLNQIDHDVREVIANQAGDHQIWLTGSPVLNLATTNVLLQDLIRIPAIVVLVMAVVLLLCFRRLSGVLVPLSTAAISVICTLAVVVKLGYTLNIVTVLVPTMLMIISLSYSIHVVTEFLELTKQADHNQRTTADALRNVFLPVVFTGLTTAIGFLSLTLSPLAAIKEFGVLSVIGILLAMLATLTWTPAILTVLHSKTQTSRNRRNAQQEKPFRKFCNQGRSI